MNHFWIIIISQSFRSLNCHIDSNITFINISLMLIRKLKMLNTSFYKIHVVQLLLIFFHCFIKAVLNENRFDSIKISSIHLSLAAYFLNIIRHNITTFILLSSNRVTLLKYAICSRSAQKRIRCILVSNLTTTTCLLAASFEPGVTVIIASP